MSSAAFIWIITFSISALIFGLLGEVEIIAKWKSLLWGIALCSIVFFIMGFSFRSVFSFLCGGLCLFASYRIYASHSKKAKKEETEFESQLESMYEQMYIERHDNWKKLKEEKYNKEDSSKTYYGFLLPSDLKRYDLFYTSSTPFQADILSLYYPSYKFSDSNPPIVARDQESQWWIELQIDRFSGKLKEIDSLSTHWNRERQYTKIPESKALAILEDDLEVRRGERVLIEDHLEDTVQLVYDNTKAKPYCVKVFDGQKIVQVTGWFAVKENAEKVFEQIKSDYEKDRTSFYYWNTKKM